MPLENTKADRIMTLLNAGVSSIDVKRPDTLPTCTRREGYAGSISTVFTERTPPFPAQNECSPRARYRTLRGDAKIITSVGVVVVSFFVLTMVQCTGTERADKWMQVCTRLNKAAQAGTAVARVMDSL